MILALSATAFVIRSFNSLSIQAQRDVNISITLAEAKSALLGYSFGRVGAGEQPGNMPMPDYFASTESPVNYDGTSDGGCLDSTKTNGLPLINNGPNMVCLGRLPWQTIGMAIGHPTQNDVLGAMPWYAVSANLTDPTCMNVINPGILNMTYTGYVCGSNTGLPHPWLTVRDSKGNIISNRVAVVLIFPDQPIGNQARPSSPLADATNYLDTVVVPTGCIGPCVSGSYSNSDLDNDFIMASGLTSANVDQNNQNLANTINDKILYITIDELIVELTKRAAGEARTLLNDYKANNKSTLPSTQFPYAGILGAALNYNKSNGVSTKGSLPIDVTDTCSCISGTSCTCNFQAITDVSFKRGSGTWNAKTSYCKYSGATCTCTGAGSCTRGTRFFSCTSSGLCANNVTGSGNTYTYTVPNQADIVSVNNGCVVSSGKVVCNAVGSFDVGLKEPTWFKTNLWQDYFYYHQSSLANLQVGTQTSVSALLIGTGSIIGAQIRPSGNVADYLESSENTDGDNIYDAIGTPHTNIYNDQSFIVAP